jgi:hypothetical protein
VIRDSGSPWRDLPESLVFGVIPPSDRKVPYAAGLIMNWFRKRFRSPGNDPKKEGGKLSLTLKPEHLILR